MQTSIANLPASTPPLNPSRIPLYHASMSHLEKNLAAMERESPDPPLAQQLRATPIPADFLPTHGTDGTPTFSRLSAASGKKQIHWLGQTSMPAASATHIIKSLDPVSNGQNGLGLSVGTGFEWAAFLRKIPRAQLLYVYEPDPAVLRMALEICDLAPLLESRRLILLAGAPDDAARQLSSFLAQNIGFEPPAVLHPLPSIPPDRRNPFLAAGEQIVRGAVMERHALLARLQKNLAEILQAPTPATPVRDSEIQAQNSELRTQNLKFLLTPRYRLERPLHSESFSAPPLYLDRHDSASLALRLQLLATCAKNGPVRIQSDLFRVQLPHMPPEIPVETWIPPLIGPGFWDRLPAPGALSPHDKIIVHHAHHAQLLKDLGIPEKHIELRPLKAPPNAASHGSSLIMHRSKIALLADLPPSDPAALGIQLPTHLAVFAAARELIIADYLTIHPGMAADILRRALARAGIDPRIDDPALKTPMLRIIRDILILALPSLTLATRLAKEGLPLLLIGDWPGLQLPVSSNAQFLPFAELTPDTWQSVALLAHLSPQGACSPLLLEALGRGVPLIAPIHPTSKNPGALPAQLVPDRDFAHPSPQQFLISLKSLLKDAAHREKLSAAARAAWTQRGD